MIPASFRFLTLLTLAFSGAALAQVVPQPSAVNPRIQTVEWAAGDEYLLTALPLTGLTVVLEPGEQIRRVTLDNPKQVEVRVSAEADSFLILPLSDPLASALLVQTDRRDYRFTVQSAMALTSAYLVRFNYGGAESIDAVNPPIPAISLPSGQSWSYRLRGDKSVRPTKLSDDGVRTKIEFAPEQDLPAVFAIGPTGDEQVVNGHMRSGVFVIDRVYQELVFRIDKDKATARRDGEAGGG
ncbi:MAG: TrbG/VirB9 family P-type conjugative transfer protein [Pontixanthobacter sp.]